MPDFPEQIRRHYDAQTLPPEKVDAILRRGAEAARGESPETGCEPEPKTVPFPQSRPRRLPRMLALAASFLLFAGLAWWWQGRERAVSFAVLVPRVVEFFQTPPELPKRSQSPEELHAWLVAQGAPPGMKMPRKMQSMQSLGCQVVDVAGRPAYLACFWRPGKEGTSPNELVHLWAVRRADFRDTPADGRKMVREMAGWSFVSWSEGDLTYTLAAAAPPDSLMPFLGARREGRPSGRLTLAAQPRSF